MEHLLTTWSYVALFALTFLSAMGIPAGSEAAIGFAGALASGQLVTSSHHHLDLAMVIATAVAGEMAGSAAGYAIGRFGGRPLIDRLGRYVLLTHRDLDRAEAWFARRGEPFVLFGRLVPLLRSFVSLPAGIGEMALGRYFAFTLAGSAIFCAALAGIGYSLGSSWHHVISGFSDAGYVLAILAVLAVAAVALHRLGTLQAERALHSPQAARARAEARARELEAGVSRER